MAARTKKILRAAQAASAIGIVGLVAVRSRALLSDGAKRAGAIESAAAMIVAVQVRAGKTANAAGDAASRDA